MLSRKLPWLFVALAVVALLACAAGMIVGRGELGDPRTRAILLELRGSRVAVAFLCGAALAVGGVLVQGLFHNPLASPSILGTTAGATLGGQIALMLSSALVTSGMAEAIAPELFLSLGSIAGALAALALVLAFARRGSRNMVTLLLAGFLLSSLFLGAGSLLVALSQDSWELGRAVVAFALGGVSGSGPRHVALATPLVLAGVIAAWLWHKPLDVLQSGEDEAFSLGLDILVARRWLIVWTAILTAGAVAVGGNVGFVGLIVPHAMRPLAGIEHRALIPAAALAGGGFVVACDVLARLPGREIPLGVITGLIGAPMFLWLLARAERQAAHA